MDSYLCNTGHKRSKKGDPPPEKTQMKIRAFQTSANITTQCSMSTLTLMGEVWAMYGRVLIWRIV